MTHHRAKPSAGSLQLERIASHGRSLTTSFMAGALLLACALFPTGAIGSSPRARLARTLHLKESSSLHLSNHHGLVLDEQGKAKGTLSAPIYIQLKVTSTRSISAQVQIYPHGGSLSGSTAASYHVEGAHASFSGRLQITKGSGTYAHAHASDLNFSGTIQRSNDATTVSVSGTLTY